MRSLIAATLALALMSGCWTNAYLAHRGLHYIHDEDGDEQLVRSPPPPPTAYESYLRAKLALEREPAQIETARIHILDALRWQSNDPQLWTVKAQIEWEAGDFAAAEAALDRALALRPDYPEAKRMLALLP